MNNSFPTHKLCADINKCVHPSRHAINNLSSSLPLSPSLYLSLCVVLSPFACSEQNVTAPLVGAHRRRQLWRRLSTTDPGRLCGQSEQ